MKKFYNFITILVLTMFMSGCVKFNANMDIEKDKSMNFRIIYAIDTSILGNEEFLTEDEKQKIIDSGFTVNDYDDGLMKGFALAKSISNIDTVSSSEDLKYSISGIMNANSNDEYLFKVKKGIFKNTYTANFIFESEDSSLDETIENNYDDSSNDNNVDKELDTDNIEGSLDTQIQDEMEENSSDFSSESENSLNGDSDNTIESDENIEDIDALMNSMSSTMDLSFEVNLPYKALSNNATSVENDGKSLKWSLKADTTENIEFVFELYNLNNIFIAGGIILLIVVLLFIVLLIIKQSKKKKTKGDKIQTLESGPMNDVNSNVQNVIQTDGEEIPVFDIEKSYTQEISLNEINPEIKKEDEQ